MTQTELDGYRQRLLDERGRALEVLNANREGVLTDDDDEAAGESAEFDPNDLSDSGTMLFDRDRNVSAVENAQGIIAKIDRALSKIEDGTYGLSDVDGSQIPRERLDALPYAVTTAAQDDDPTG